MKKKQGLASLSPERRREISSMGGKKTHAQGSKPKGFAAQPPERRREAGRKGGLKKKEDYNQIGDISNGK